ncbi:MAG: hypothetical protein WDM89_16380 [Rhizomicrobium sp.]
MSRFNVRPGAVIADIAQRIQIPALPDEKGASADFQIGFLEGDNDLRRDRAVLGEKIRFIRTQTMLENDRAVHDLRFEEGSSRMRRIVGLCHRDRRKIEDSAGGCRPEAAQAAHRTIDRHASRTHI